MTGHPAKMFTRPFKGICQPRCLLRAMKREEITKSVAPCQVVVALLICHSREGMCGITVFLEPLPDRIDENPLFLCVFYRTHT